MFIGISNNENSRGGAEYKIKRGSFVERRGRNKEYFTKIQTDTLTHENKPTTRSPTTSH